jgi:hypothetical protein
MIDVMRFALTIMCPSIGSRPLFDIRCRASAAAAAAQVHVDVLLAREAQQFLDAFLAADAGLFVAAERRAEKC